MQLMLAINALQQSERVNLYHTFASSITEVRAVAGVVYESLGHTHLLEGISLALRRMIKLSPNQQQRHLHWKSQGKEPGSNSMDLDVSGMSVIFSPSTGIRGQADVSRA